MFAKVESDLGAQILETLENIKTKQELMLISGGLKSTFNSTITKLMMANHGYSDKVEQVVTSDEDIQSVTVSIKSAKKSTD